MQKILTPDDSPQTTDMFYARAMVIGHDPISPQGVIRDVLDKIKTGEH